MHYRLLFDGKAWGRFVTREDAEAASQVHREHGECPTIIEVEGDVIPPTQYGERGRVVPPDLSMFDMGPDGPRWDGHQD